MAKTRLIQEIDPQKLHQMGVFEVRKFTVFTEVYIILPRLPWQRNFGNFDEKMAKTRLIHKIEPQMLTKKGVFELRQFTDVIEIYIRPTLVAVVTKIWDILDKNC